MARRRRSEASALDTTVDEVDVRWRAARRAHLHTTAFGESQVSSDDPWWERWNDEHAAAWRSKDRERMVASYERAINRVGGQAIYERELSNARRHLELNTPAARAARARGLGADP